MVQLPRGRSAVITLLLAILLALPAMPSPLNVTPLASADGCPVNGQDAPCSTMQLRVNQSGIIVSQGGVRTHFINNDSGSLTVDVPVLNYGTGHSSTLGNIPFFAWYEPYIWHDDWTRGTYDLAGHRIAGENDTLKNVVQGTCGVLKQTQAPVGGTVTDVPAATTSGGAVVPGVTWAHMTLPIPGKLAEGESLQDSMPAEGYAIIIMVNRAPVNNGTAKWPPNPINNVGNNPAFYGRGCSGSGETPIYGSNSQCPPGTLSAVGCTGPSSCTSGDESAGMDCNGSDNVGFAYIVKDAAWDLKFKDVKICRGDVVDASGDLKSDLSPIPEKDCSTATGSSTTTAFDSTGDRTSFTFSNGARYNSTRRNDTWACKTGSSDAQEQAKLAADCAGSNAPPDFGDTAPATMYFSVRLDHETSPTDPATGEPATAWQDDRDRGNCTKNPNGWYDLHQISDGVGSGSPAYPDLYSIDLNSAATLRLGSNGVTNCIGLPIPMGLTMTGPGLPAAGLDLGASPPANGWWHSATADAWASQPFNLTGVPGSYGPLGGTYNVSAAIDPGPQHKVPEVDRRNDYYNMSDDWFNVDDNGVHLADAPAVHVASTDLATWIDPAGLPVTFDTAQPYVDNFTITPKIHLFNNGTARPTKFLSGEVPQDRPVNVSVWVDNYTNIQSGICTNDLQLRQDAQQEGKFVCSAIGAYDVSKSYPYEYNLTSANSNAISFKFTSSYAWSQTTDAQSKNVHYIPPGTHTIHACIDCDPANPGGYSRFWSGNNTTFEMDKTNNNVTQDILIEDTALPTFLDTVGGLTPRLTFGRSDDYNDTAGTICALECQHATVHPLEDLNVTMNVTDPDQSHLNVTFEFTHLVNSTTTITWDYAPCPDGSPATATDCVQYAGDGRRFFAWVDNLTLFDLNDSSEAWNVVAIANNSFHVNTTAATPFVLAHWRVQSADEDEIVYGVRNATSSPATFDPDDGTYSWSNASVSAPYWIYLTQNLTGVADQPNVTSNIGLRIDFPPDAPLGVAPANNTGCKEHTCWFNGTDAHDWVVKTTCGVVNGQPDPTGKLPITCTDVGNFSSLDLATLRNRTGPGWPGRWNLSISITDKAGEVRVVNRTLTWVKNASTMQNDTLSSYAVAPGASFHAKVNVSDDFGANATYLNFSRELPTPYSVGILLHDSIRTTEGGFVNDSYDDIITTGHGALFGVAGNFSTWFSTVDQFGDWRETAPVRFYMNDTTDPVLLDAGVDQRQQETNFPVTFHANATDNTNITAHLEIVGPDGTTDPAMNETTLGNFTYTTNFTTPGNYVWHIWIEDSFGHLSDRRSGLVSVSSNLGPRFNVTSPNNEIDGKLYASAQPTIRFVVYDAQGVAKDSINLTVGGTLVTPDSIVSSTDPPGWIVTYAVRTAQRFHHGDIIPVNVTAIDLSTQALPGFEDLSFTVDDTPPTAHLVDMSPRYRGAESDVWNVSLQTQFTLGADDNDGLPTGVGSILYTIVGSGSAPSPTTYTGPFTIGSVPGVFTGPRSYVVQFWAVDSVGNENHTRQFITAYVDDLPPGLDPLNLPLKQGRFVNASFLDDRTGVERASVWYSVNGAPYQQQALTLGGGVWSAVLPEGQNGDVVSYYYQAWDRVGNTDTFGNASAPYATYTVGNHAPQVQIVSPADGTTVQGSVDLAWTASDPDNDPLSFTVQYRPPGKDEFVDLVPKVPAGSLHYAIDTSQFADGQYTFRVGASDGTLGAASETTVTVLNRGTPFGHVTSPQGDVPTGNSVLLTVQITKAQAVVEARLFRDGAFVNAYPMNDEGRDGDAVAGDGTYSVRVAPDQPGDYKVDFAAHYQEGGQTKDATLADQAHFTVKLTSNAIFQQYGVFLVLVALLAIASIGVAVFVLRRR